MPEPLTDFKRLCLHTITTKPWSIETAIAKYSKAGVHGITVWRQWLQDRKPRQVGDQIRDAGLQIVSTCRGGFFPALDLRDRQKAISDNLRAIEEAHELGAPQVVLVVGAAPGQSLAVSRQQIRDGIATILPHARAAKVKLAVEPLHPMYAADRSAINTLKQANDFCDAFNDPYLGIAVDVYHLWWDPDLQQEIHRCGAAGRIFAFHVCDWRVPTIDFLNDRGLMGEGCIALHEIREWVEEAGFHKMIEVEIFSNRWWAADQDQFLQEIKKAYLQHV